MRLLNSLLLEGVLLDTPVYSDAASADEPDWCTFTIGSEPDSPSVPVVTYGRLALRCSQILTKGSAIRVVGRIAQNAEATAATGTFRLCVVAEHIEIKPIPSPKLIPVEAENDF
jgi:single-stranded DNA-binding protein